MQRKHNFFKTVFSINSCIINYLGELLKNDTRNETSIPNFEPVIDYVQRLCLCMQSKRDKSVLFLIIFIFHRIYVI